MFGLELFKSNISLSLERDARLWKGGEMFVMKEFPNRIFDSEGNGDGWDFVEIPVLENVTFNGGVILEDDFDQNGRFI